MTVTGDTIATLRWVEGGAAGPTCTSARTSRPSSSVCVIMGSDSNLPVMQNAGQVQSELRADFRICTLHACSYVLLRTVCCGEGCASHHRRRQGGLWVCPAWWQLLRTREFIGVPMQTSIFSADDSLLSIVQMTKEIPVATVAIGNATNAGLLAVRI